MRPVSRWPGWAECRAAGMANLGALRLAVQGLRFRRGVAASMLVVAVVTVAAAAVGPAFARSGSESMLQDALRTSPVSETGIGVQSNTTPTPAALADLEGQLPTAAALPGFPTRIRSLQLNGALARPRDNAVLARGRFVWREGACEHLRVLAGHCPTTARTIAVSTRSARLYGWHLGTSLLAQGFGSPTGRPPAVTVVGLYSPINAGDRYWFDFPYFDAGENDGSDIDSVFVAESTMAEAQGNGRVVIELPLDVAAVRLANVDQVQREADAVLAQFAALTSGDVMVTNNLDQLLAAAAHERQQLSVLVTLVALQLLVLGYLVLYLLVANASDARGPELALARLRGGRARSAIAFGLLEPVILLVLAVPLGLLVALGFLEVVARRTLLTATPVTLPLSSVLGALGALCGGMIAAGLAARRALRRPIAEQLRRVATERAAGGLAGPVDVAVIVLAVAGLVELRLSGGVSNGKVDNLALLTPGLLALAAALLGVRLLPVAGRGLAWGTRNQRDVGVFLALRQLTRRPAVLRVVILLGTAVGLATFAVAVTTTAGDNRQARAATEVGADRVVLVAPVSAQQLLASVRRLDPDGRWAMAVQQHDPFGNQPGGSLLAVDSSRLPAVATWRSDFAAPPLPRLAAALHPGLPPPVVLAGSALRVLVLVTRLVATVPLDLHALLAQYSGGTIEVDLGRLASGERDYTASLTSCTPPCRLVGLTVARPLAEYPRIAGTLVIRGIAERGPRGWAAVPAGLTDRRRWQPTRAPDDASGTDSLLATAVGLRYDFTALSTDAPGVAPIDAPSPLPAVSTRQAFGTSFAPAYPITGLDGQPATAEAVGLATVLPRVQDDGTMVDLTYAGRTMTAGLADTSSEVWLGARAPADALRRIAALGFGVISVDSTRDHRARLDRSGPALGLLLFLVGAALATLLAMAGTVVSVYLTGRRRAFEVAALRAVGLTSGSLLRAAVLEQALLLLAGLVVGSAAGLVAAVLALPSVPIFADGRAVPALRLGLHAVPLVLLVLGITALLVAVAVLAGWALVRSAVPARLREAQP